MTTDTSTLRRLTPNELATYHAQGFVEVPDIFSADNLTEITAEIERLRALKPKGSNRNILLRLGLHSPLTAAICRDERILTLIEDIVKPGIAIYSAKMVEKLPFDDALCHWHQDNVYYNENSASDCRMSVWIPLQDVTEANGCLWVVPGSHRTEIQPAERVGNGHCDLALAHGNADIDGAVPCPMKAGGVLLFHGNLWHRSLGNTTADHRRTFIISYQDATCPSGNGDQHKILRPGPAEN